MRYRIPFLLMFVVSVFFHIATAAPLCAQESCRVSVDTILAARNNAGIDPQLERHIGELRSMFNFTSYRLLGSQRLDLRLGQSGVVALPGDRRLKITPRHIRDNRTDIALQMMRGRRTVFQTQIRLINRGNLFVGGPSYQNGNLIFKISSAY